MRDENIDDSMERECDSNDLSDSKSAESSDDFAESTNDLNAESENIAESSTEESDKIKALEEKYIRAYAEFDNVKKRLEREKYQSLEYANEQILKDFLPILDTLESALESTKNVDSEAMEKTLEKTREGIALTIDNFLKAFSKHSVERISTEGEFDPNLHNAIMQIKSEGKADGEIAQVIQKGYKYKDRVIRPSMVAITKN